MVSLFVISLASGIHLYTQYLRKKTGLYCSNLSRVCGDSRKFSVNRVPKCGALLIMSHSSVAPVEYLRSLNLLRAAGARAGASASQWALCCCLTAAEAGQMYKLWRAL